MDQNIVPFDVAPQAGVTKERTVARLKVVEVGVYRGPHLYSHRPMVRIQLDLGQLESSPTDRLPGFTAALLELLPGLRRHHCSTGHEGGFVERLQDGTWLGHVIEHVALELQARAGMKVGRGKTRSVKGHRGIYNVMYQYKFEQAGRCAGRLALELVASLLKPPFDQVERGSLIHPFTTGARFDVEAGLAELRRLARIERLGPTTQSIVDAAVKRHIPWTRLDQASLIQLGNGRYQKRLRASITGQTSHIAVETASDKDLTKRLLSDAGAPVPRGQVVREPTEAQLAARRIGFPVTVKPLDGNHGRGVGTNLSSDAEVAQAFARAREHSRRVIVEQHYNGRDYRVLVIKGEVVAVAERVPAHVVGNGRDSIARLIEQVNADPRRGDGHEEVMTRIKTDAALLARLQRLGLTLDTVPPADQRVVLADTANLSTGGTAIDRTDDIHPDNASAARRAALAVGLDIAGIDMVMPDIARSWREVGGGIVEVNAAPGFRMHVQPSQGKPRPVGEAVVSMLFPPGTPSHVPVAVITGTNGKSTTVRMLAHILRHAGRAPGFTSTSGVFVDNQCLWKGDASGPQSARMLLANPAIDCAVLEAARGGILRAGLGVPHCDVGAVLNVSADHLGLGGIATIDDLAAVKSVVVESVARHGISVLNADDPRTAAMAAHAGGSVCFFSTATQRHGFLQRHIEQDGRAVCLEGEGDTAQIVAHHGDRRSRVMAVNDIPAVYNGAAAFNVQNALAATAVAHAMGVDYTQIREALALFTSSFEQNPGRFNVHDDHGFRIVMDYAHNPAALEALFAVVRSMRARHGRIIGHVSTPGDRRDDDIREVGAIAARELDVVVFRELPDNRGRKAGEVVQLLAEGARQAGYGSKHIICVRGEDEATDVCLRAARPGDLVILTPSDIDGIWRQVLAFQPQSARQAGASSFAAT